VNGCGGKMKISSLLISVLLLSSCGQIQRVLNNAEGLSGQIDHTNQGIDKTNNNLTTTSETIRLQKLDTALNEAKDPKNRANLFPIPFDMMTACKIVAETLTPEEAVLLMKNYMLKISEAQWSAELVLPAVTEAEFEHSRMADFFMIKLIAGFLPDETVKAIVEKESNQGAYQDIMLKMLKLRYDFNSGTMVKLAMLGLNPTSKNAAGEYEVLKKDVKLDTLGKIEKAIEYNEKVEYICNLEFADNIDYKDTDYKIELVVYQPLDSRSAKENWQLILDHAQSDYKAASFSKDPSTNDKKVQEYTTRYNELIDRLKAKISGT
jgi:hypothetical protein